MEPDSEVKTSEYSNHENFAFFQNNCRVGNTTISNVNPVTLSGGITINGTLTSTNMQFVGGTISGTNALAGLLVWSGGIFAAGSATAIATNSTLIVAGGGNNMDLNAVVFTNHGAVTWASGTLRGGNGTTVYNYGSWDCQSDQQFNSAYGGAGVTFNNYGTLRKSGGAGEFSSYTLFTAGVLFNQLAGMIAVQNGTNGLELAFQGSANLLGGYRRKGAIRF